LEILHLSGKNLSDRSIGSFVKMHRLKELAIGSSPITDSAISELSKQKPALKIRHRNAPRLETGSEPVDASTDNADEVDSEPLTDGTAGES
jgi:hypothetical protein